MAVATKLTPQAWWRSLGSPRYVAAPMVDASELPFRLLVREFGAQLCYTPMLHSRLLVEQPGYLEANFSTCAQDRPLIAQLCGNDPALVLAAAQRLEGRGVDAIDLNLGCPQGIAKRGHYGAFLLDEPDTIVAMVRALAGGLSVPVTCKIRVLPTLEATLALARAIEAAGASLLTVHGRLRTNMKQSISVTDWDIIRAIKAALSIPVLANGSMASRGDAEACLAATGADGVMLSEALLENPGLFSGGWPTGGPLAAAPAARAPPHAAEPGRAPLDQFALTRRYLELAEGAALSDLGVAKGHVFKQLYGVWRVFPDLMEQLAVRSYSLANVRSVVAEAEARYRGVFGGVLFEGGSEAGAGSSSSDSSSGSSVAAPAPLAPYGPELQAALQEASALQAREAAADPRLAWSAPYYLVDPAQPGAWYMRHRASGSYGGALPPYVAGAPNGQLRGPDLGKFRVSRRPGGAAAGEGAGEAGGEEAEAGAGAQAQPPPTLAQRLAVFKAAKAISAASAAAAAGAAAAAAAAAAGSAEAEALPPNLWGCSDEC